MSTCLRLWWAGPNKTLSALRDQAQHCKASAVLILNWTVHPAEKAYTCTGCPLGLTHLLMMQADGNSTGVGNPPGYCYKEQPAWSAYRESSFGHGTLDLVNSTHALWSCERLPHPWGLLWQNLYFSRYLADAIIKCESSLSLHGCRVTVPR